MIIQNEHREPFPRNVGRPYTIYNCAMSLDGRLSTISNDSAFSSKEDWMRVHRLRDAVDGICVGIGTVLSDDPKLRVKFLEAKKNPDRIIIDSMLKIPTDAQCLLVERDGVRVLIGTTSAAMENRAKVLALEKVGVELIDCGEGKLVNLKTLWRELFSKGIHSIMVEGGGTVAGSLLVDDLIDEIRVFIAPVLVGGNVPPATCIMMGQAFETVQHAIQLELVSINKCGNGLLAKFQPCNGKEKVQTE
ncbi:5-amino-6-(5-phosphoribosylamino)uracil reductase [Candidatus Bathyarchaeota archaeon]|nr:5-amino-6-(5-phosphoribosylamino)uracil reductase [Candidatus Bathyarchaeota archaeon]